MSSMRRSGRRSYRPRDAALHFTCLLEFQTAAPPVIASEAKQSISLHKGRMDCFRLRSLSYGGQVVALLVAMTWRECGHDSASSRRHAPELCQSFAQRKRAQETPGALGTRSPCAMVVSTR